MSFNYFPSKFLLLFAFSLCIFNVNHFSQTINAEKQGSVGAFVRDRDEYEEAGLVRKRAIPETVKLISSVKPAASEIPDLEKMVVSLINQKRAEKGLPPLVWSDDVAKIARLHSENMVKFNFFSHMGMDGKMVNGRADSLGITKWTAMGENIAYNRGFRNPIETAVEKWLLSPTHRDNLLNDGWKETAVGIAVTDDGTYFFTQVFIKRR
jgi:uncharacterized protein YkwD